MARRRKKPAAKEQWIDRAPCLPDETFPDYDRARFRACLVDQAVGTRKKAKGRPVALLTMGVPGTGKTTVIAPLLKKRDFVCSCPDEVKDQLPEYTQAIKDRAKNAGTVVQKESVEIASEIANRAIRERKSILIDGTGAVLARYEKVIKRLKRAGYHVTVIGVHAPFPVVKSRLESRFRQTGRYVPEKVAAWYAKEVPCNFLPVAKMADEFALYENTKEPRPILVKETGKAPVVRDQSELDRITGRCAVPARPARLGGPSRPQGSPAVTLAEIMRRIR